MRILFVVIALALCAVPVLAQTSDNPGVLAFEDMLLTLGGLAALTVLVSEGIVKILNTIKDTILMDGWKGAVLSLLVALAICLVSAILDLGMFAIPEFSPLPDWQTGGAVGIVTWFVSRGIFSTTVAQIGRAHV